MLQEFIFDKEAPTIPPHYQTIIFLNKQEEKLQKIKTQSALETTSSIPVSNIVKILDETLAPPTHAEL